MAEGACAGRGGAGAERDPGDARREDERCGVRESDARGGTAGGAGGADVRGVSEEVRAGWGDAAIGCEPISSAEWAAVVVLKKGGTTALVRTHAHESRLQLPALLLCLGADWGWGGSGFGEPGFGFGEFRLIEILNLGQREGFAEGGHALFPFGFADDGEAFDVFPVLEVELHVFPDRSGGPAVEVVHLEENAELAVLLDELIDERREGLVRLLGQLPSDFDVKEFS